MENPENLELSRFYAFTMKSIGQKLLCKMYVIKCGILSERTYQINISTSPMDNLSFLV
jgi:hypothetical protein